MKKGGDATIESLERHLGDNQKLNKAYHDVLKNVIDHDDLPQCKRGRTDFAKVGLVRTKPGRNDSPNTESMSCR